jgi:exopolysaccharide production protein ExoZ
MINSIQYLRGVAALLVVYYHSTIKAVQNDLPTAEIFNIGESGVDLFFIISGFIICFVTDKKDFNCFEFLKLRVLRIIPLYWFFTLIALVAYFAVPSMVNSSGGETLIFESFFLIPTEGKYLIQNGWTLSYEFYFYIICAVLLFFNLNKIWILTILCFLPVLSYWFDLYFFFDKFLIEFAMGALSYIVYTKKTHYKTQSAIVLIFCLGYFLLMISTNLSNRVILYGVPMWLLFHAGLLINTHLKYLDTKIAGRFLHLLGDSSYSLYLSHTFALVFFNKIYIYLLGNNNLIGYLTFLSCTSVFCGYFVFKYIEVPLNYRVKKYFSNIARPNKLVIPEKSDN